MKRTVVFGTAPCEIIKVYNGEVVTDYMDVEIPGANTKEKFMKEVKREFPECLVNVTDEITFIARTYSIDKTTFFEHAKMTEQKDVPEGYGTRKKGE